MTLAFSDSAKLVLEKRYLKKDLSGRIIETPEQMLQRVAHHVARADRHFEGAKAVGPTEKAFLRMMSNLWFLPNSPTLMNAGRKLGQLAACFVLPVGDSIESIFDAVKHTALIHKSGGGTGFSFSHIRPANDSVSTTIGVSSGPLSFMTVFDVATDAVRQGGARRGANMGLLRVDHPDIEAFITAKTHLNQLTNFNLSVGVTQKFLDALTKGDDYELINPRTGQPVRKVAARMIFDLIVQSAWQSGEPGVIFIDRINTTNPTPHLGAIEATNPCGEQPLLPWESCTLGSINLSAMVSSKGLIFKRIKQTVHDAVHFLDNVIEVNQYPLPEIEKASKLTRKIGIGIMGFADMLIKMGIPYDSQEALEQAETVMAVIHDEARSASAELGARRGNFPAFDGSVFDGVGFAHMRNATVTTIAPTGTISIIAGASSGIEPIFAVAQARLILDNQWVPEIHPLFIKIAKEEGFHSADLEAAIIRNGSVQGLAAVPETTQRLFRTAHDIAPQWHVQIQAAFQRHTDNAVSKTVNFPAEATLDDVARVFTLAAQKECKGVTIYRYGSRQNQVLNVGGGIESERIAPRPRPQRTHGLTERIGTGCGKLYVTINSDDKGMCEVFAQMGKTGGCASSQIEAAGRLISLALRSGVKPEAIIKQMTGIRCPSPVWQNGKMVLSCPDAMAQVLNRVVLVDVDPPRQPAGACPDCGGGLTHSEGCLHCPNCGFSKCS